MYDVVGIGELLIDFTPEGKSDTGNPMFVQNAGGATANVIACVSKLGGKSAFIGEVGNDVFGNYLKKVLEDNGIDNSGVKFCKSVNTTLAFVSLDEHGDRNFSFYRRPGADIMLEPEDVDFNLIDKAKIFHFGSLSMTDEPSKSATKAALKYAVDAGKIISYDPNYRKPLWNRENEAIEGMKYGLQFADIIKISEDELEMLTGEKSIETGAKELLNMGIKIVAVTMGSKGCYFRCQDGNKYMNTYDTNVVDTTGSGDAFMGAMLYSISTLNIPLEKITAKQLEKIVDFSNACGALCASYQGGIPSMPTIEAIETCRRSVPILKK
jgi:fructokinase